MIDKNTIARRHTIVPPLGPKCLSAALAALPFQLPEDYTTFLTVSDGMITDNDLILLDAESLGQRNADYQVQVYLPNFVMIGDDGGGIAVLMKIGEPTIYEVGMGAMDLETMEVSALSLDDLLIAKDGTPLSYREK